MIFASGNPESLETARTGRKTEVSYMLITHINRLEKHLLSTSQLPASADHAAPRDILVKEFLQNHVSQKLAIGEGIIIDSDSKINGTYNQIDIVLYKPEFPKIRLPKNVDGFLAESVLATIEINSMLEEDDVLHSVKVARDVKALKRSLATAFTTGYHPPGILNFLVAFDGPSSMKTVHSWIRRAEKQLGIEPPALPPTLDERIAVSSPALDAVFVLGKGYVQFDNAPFTFVGDALRHKHPDLKWSIAESPAGSLFVLFALLALATSGAHASWLDPSPYLKNFSVETHCAAS